ncbi:MAG: Septum site-determining protein MinD [Candidatus Heimdallarchaeota archaeon LC_3]|nr:MAG: Septum site-determining protein MinD [Candidatus Heimdallarchaeota archaeon LC_3]
MSKKIDINKEKKPEETIKNIIGSLENPLWDDGSLGDFLKDVKIKRAKLELTFEIPVPKSNSIVTSAIEKLAYQALENIDGIVKTEIKFNSDVNTLNKIELGNKLLSNIKNIIAVASNKGGVGKSTVAANIAAALKILGAKVAVLDLDIYGPNVPNMFGINSRPRYFDKLISPVEKYGIPLMSVGFLLENDASPIILRAPLVNRVVMEFLQEVKWEEADYMIVDLPPGTGDIQLTLAQQLPNTKIIFVTTPQDVALADVFKGVRMFQQEGIALPILGVVENMSYFVCDQCHKKHEIFDSGGAKSVADTFDIQMYGEIPLYTELRVSGDRGKPIVLQNPEHPVSKTFIEVAEKLSIDIAQYNHQELGRSDRIVIPLDL